MRRIVYKELPQNRRFGVELELSNNLSKQEIGKHLLDFESMQIDKKQVKVTSGATGWAETNRNNYWHVKYDSTCGPHGKGIDFGWEVASYIGMGSADIDHISRAAWYLKKSGCGTNQNCGLHVHVEVGDFDAYMMGVMLARWIKIENIMLQICESSRQENTYCQHLGVRCHSRGIVYSPIMPRSFWHAIKPADLNVHNNMEKRYTLNTVGFAIGLVNKEYTRKTIELRLPECKLEEPHIRNWISLILQFVDASSKKCVIPTDINTPETIEEALIYLGLNDEDNFYMLDEKLLNLKVWFLRKVAMSDISWASQARKHLEFISQV